MNFVKQQLYELHKEYKPLFEKLSQEAKKNNVFLTLIVSPFGDIHFASTEFFSNKGKNYQRLHEIRQGKTKVSEKSETKQIGDN